MAAPENRATGQQLAYVASEVSGRQAGIQGTKQTASDDQPPICRVCERTGETNDANTFCVECNDHMCGTCARAHRGSKPTSRHQLLDKSQMPRKAFKVRHMCDTHPDTLIEYYCKKQDQLLCRHCITLNHQGCQGDDLISNMCDHIGDSREFKKMYQGLKQIKENITQHEAKQKDNLSDIDNNQHKVRCDIDTIKKELYLFVDRLVDEAYGEVEGLVDKDKKDMAIVSEEIDKVAAEVNSLITEIDIKKQSKVDMQLFITMKVAQQAIEILGLKMQSIDTQNRIRKYNFEPDKQLRDVMGSVQKLGHLSVEGGVPVQSASVHKLGQLSVEGGVPVQSASVQKLGQLSVEGGVPVQSASVQKLGQLSVEGGVPVQSASVQKLGQLSVEGGVPVQSASVQKLGQLSVEGGVLVQSASVQKLGQLSVEGGVPVQSASACRDVTQRPNSAPERTVASKIDELAIKDKRDKSDCAITGIELVDDNRIAMVDNDNSSVKIVSISKKRVTHQRQLRDQPWDITKVNTNTLAVTCNGDYIQLVSVPSRSGSLSLGRQIQVQGECYGIQYSGAGGGRLVVSFAWSGKVQVIDMSGTVLKELSSDSAGTRLFAGPRYVALSPDGQCVYVSDWSNHTVTGITLDGRVVFTYRDDQLRGPDGLAVGEDGVIYVCGTASHNIHMVSSEGKNIKVLLGKEHGMKVPRCIMYQQSEHKLYVGMNKGVHVFTLTQ